MNLIIDKYFRFNKWNDAKNELEIYIKSYPTDPDAYRLYGTVLAELKLYDEAIISLRNAINYEKSDEKKGELYYNLGLNYYSKGLKSVAVQMFDISSNLNNILDLPYYIKGVIYYENKEPEKAITSWKHYVTLASNKEKKEKMERIIALYEKQLLDEKLRIEEEKRKKEELMNKLLKELEGESGESKSLEADKKKQKDNTIEFEDLK
ncbi:MAG: tetratricopeptide repeat protein [Spirochaetes bacterium]|nr:tetratricopeptide repeat protein [Spirochaetota bacterium]